MEGENLLKFTADLPKQSTFDDRKEKLYLIVPRSSCSVPEHLIFVESSTELP
jgi:hypothetical protein